MHFNMQPAWHTIYSMVWSLIARLPDIIVGILVFGIFLLLGRGLRKLIFHVAEKHRRHRHLSLVLGRLAQAACIALGVLVALVVAIPSFKPGQLVQLLGVSGVAIGFAFRDILQNFLAGLLILITEPFRIGDQIHVENFEGVVEDIKTRATMIRTYDGRRVVMPNADLFTKSVTVNTAYDNRRAEYDIGIGYGDDIERAKTIILDTIRAVPNILEKPAPDVLVVGLADYQVTLRARWWINPPSRAEVLASTDKVLTAVKRALVENGIDLPFPTQQILLHDQTEATDGDRSRQREGWPAGHNAVPRPAREEQPRASENGHSASHEGARA